MAVPDPQLGEIVELLAAKFGYVRDGDFSPNADLVLLKTCTMMYRCLEKIENLSDDPKHLHRIHTLAKRGLNAVDSL